MISKVTQGICTGWRLSWLYFSEIIATLRGEFINATIYKRPFFFTVVKRRQQTKVWGCLRPFKREKNTSFYLDHLITILVKQFCKEILLFIFIVT